LLKRFGGTAVNHVSFSVGQGEILDLIGPNGSGKSTIFDMLSGTLSPSAGSIIFDGAEIAGLAPHRQGVAAAIAGRRAQDRHARGRQRGSLGGSMRARSDRE
jgi:ABC-type branched-subunit amino acid transport system ATPase component